MTDPDRLGTIVARIEASLGLRDLTEQLADDLPPTQLQSLMLAVYRRAALARTPATVLERFASDDFVRPCPIAPTTLLRIDRAAFEHAEAMGFGPVELSPLTPLATCVSVAPVDPNNVVSTSRNTEVVSDPTNVMALECALRRRALLQGEPRSAEVVRLCASHRAVRGQRFDIPGFTQHFRLLALCSAGRDRGTLRFECEALRDHLRVHLRLLLALRTGPHHHRIDAIAVRIVDRSGSHEARLRAEVIDPLRDEFTDVGFEVVPDRGGAHEYYPGLSFMLDARDPEGVVLPIADGGSTDWTAQLLSNRKERLFISGVGTELLCARFGPDTARRG